MTCDMTCDICGAELIIGGGPGEWCKGDPEYHKPMKIHGLFDPFTPYVDPHILPFGDPRANVEGVHPVLGKIRGTLIESREQRRAIMKEQNLDWAPRPYGEGGSEI